MFIPQAVILRIITYREKYDDSCFRNNFWTCGFGLCYRSGQLNAIGFLRLRQFILLCVKQFLEFSIIYLLKTASMYLKMVVGRKNNKSSDLKISPGRKKYIPFRNKSDLKMIEPLILSKT